MSGLRDAIRHAMENGAHHRAATLLSQSLREQPTANNASYVVARFREMRSHLQLTPCRLAVLRSFTVEPLMSFLQARCFGAGIDASVSMGGFNTYAQEILDPGSFLYQQEPDIVIVAVRAPDVVPALWYEFADLPVAEIKRIVTQTVDDFKSWIETFRARSTAHLILPTLELPAYVASGVLDTRHVPGQSTAIQDLNEGLRQLVREHAGVHLLDYDGLVARHGRLRWHDERKWVTMRMPIAADCLIHLADEYMRLIRPLTGRVCKALVVDLDNTLWGGIVGEDGPEGLQLGLDYPGVAYRTCQRVILDLYQRGVILAVCSKNNPSEAHEVLERHPQMLLRPAHFAAMQINWGDKVQNLQKIAAELNIGIDALAFLDDSPVERQAVRDRLPEVYVIDLPADPMLYAPTLRECSVFERVGLSEEDKERGRYYAEQRQRAQLQQAATSLEEFYHSLRMRAEIAEVDGVTLPRIAQLTQKTNQFTLTTRRYSEQELEQMRHDPRVRMFSVRLMDRFGDSGIVGAAISRTTGDRSEIDTFLLSCRAIGRTVETALLARVAEAARRDGAKELTGWYVPTKKNAPARDCYAKHGFSQLAEEDDRSLWKFDLVGGRIAVPEWIECAPILIKEGSVS